MTAMDFLMDYGWAILIVIAVIVSLFAMGVFNLPAQRVSQTDSNMVYCNELAKQLNSDYVAQANYNGCVICWNSTGVKIADRLYKNGTDKCYGYNWR